MRPRERRDSGQNDLFRSRLDQIVDREHALAKLGRAIDWRFLEERFGAVYTDKAGHPPLPTRLGWAFDSQAHARSLRRGSVRPMGREPLLPALLRRGVFPAQADLRPLVADALAPADGGGAPDGVDPGEPVSCDAHRRGQAGGLLQGDRRHDGSAQGGGLSDRRQADASGARAAGRSWPNERASICASPTSASANMR